MRYLLWLAALALAAQPPRIENLAPYTATPEPVVRRMLELAELQPGEKMFDLGSGDGRIVVMAAKQFQADATGVEFDDTLYRRSMDLIRTLGLSETARIIPGDLMKQDYSSARVITVYLLPIASLRLTPLLERQLKKGARVVSHNAAFPEWKPAKIEDIQDGGDGKSHKLFLYIR
jgi:protein-L-isoaspartate O-methyltransferase